MSDDRGRAGGDDGEGMSDQPVKLTKRHCRICGQEFRTALYSRPIGCPDCAPELKEEPRCTCERLFPGSPPPPVHAPDCPLYEGLPF